MRAERPADSGLFGLSRYERVYRAIKSHPDPLMEFCLGWIRRNPPDSKGRESAVVWDSGQFHWAPGHHDADGRITAVLDVEIGHIGDPMMDLAAWRMRDTIIGYGDFDQLYARYGELAGAPVDLEAIKRHHFVFTLTNQLGLGQLMRTPPPGSDLMTNMQWCYETNLFATEALAEILDVELPTVDVPDDRWSRATPGLGQLVDGLRNLTIDDEFVRYQVRTLFRAARHVDRVNEVGDAFDAADLDDLHQLLGHRPDSWLEGEAELERFVLTHADSSEYDEQLLHVFHRRNLRAHMLLGPAGSAMTEAPADPRPSGSCSERRRFICPPFGGPASARCLCRPPGRKDRGLQPSSVGHEEAVRDSPRTELCCRWSGRLWTRGKFGHHVMGQPVANFVLRARPGQRRPEEAVGPLLGQLPGLAEVDGHGRPAHLQLGEPIGNGGRTDVLELEDVRVAVLHHDRGAWQARQLRQREAQLAVDETRGEVVDRLPFDGGDNRSCVLDRVVAHR